MNSQEHDIIKLLEEANAIKIQVKKATELS